MSDRLDVAFVNRMAALNRGGGEIWDLKMAEALRDHGVEVTFYVATPLFGEPSAPVEQFQSVEVSIPHLQDIALGAPRGIGGALSDVDRYVFARRVAGAIDAERHDVVHVNTYPEFSWFTDRFDVPVTIKMNGPPHSLWHDVLNPFSSSYQLLERFDGVVATGITTEAIRERTDCDVTTINPGVDVDQFVPSSRPAGSGSETRTVLFVGRFVPAKNVTLLVRAVASLADTVDDVELVLVGDGPLKDDVETEVERRGLGGTVRLEGYVPNGELPAYYRSADVFALASRRDNHPITILEAMATGTPVVAPDVGWIPRLVTDDRTGIVYDEGSREQLRRALERLLENPDRRAEMGTAARSVATDRFSWDERAGRFRTFLEGALES